MRSSPGCQERRVAYWAFFESTHVHRKLPARAVQIIIAQRSGNGAKRKLIPWNVFFVEKTDLETLGPGSEIEVEQPGAEHHIDLTDVRQADHGIERADVDAGARFFRGFAQRASDQRLAIFEKSGRQCPQAQPWLDRALAKKHLLAPLRQAADNDLWILIVNRGARGAHVARQRVAVGHPKIELRRPAMAAEFHDVAALIKC